MNGTAEQKVALPAEREGFPVCGHLIWYTVSDLSVTRDQLREHFRQAGVSEEWLPPPVRPIDAYRKATGQTQRTVEPGEAEVRQTGVVERRYRFEEVLADSRRVIRHLVRVDVDARAVELRMAELAGVIFDRGSGGLQVQVLDSDPVAGELLDEVESRFRHHRQHYDADAIRRTLGRMLAAMDPTLFKDSGGFWFVPQKHAGELLGFRRLLEALGLRYGTMPVVDTEDARQLVREMFEHQVLGVVQRLASLLRRPVEELQKSDVVSGLEVARDLVRQVREYEQVLRQDLEDLALQAGLVQQQVAELVERVVSAG